MGQPPIRNLSAIQAMPVYGRRIVEALQDVRTLVKNVAQQLNANTTGQQGEPPPAINALHVTASGGVAHIQIDDNNAIYRGIEYHVQYSLTPGFENACTEHMGPSRDRRISVGSQPLYWRAYSDYQTSPPSNPVYHGGASPIPIAAIGANQPAIPAGKGSGTGTTGQISGYGPIAFRGPTPPVRS